MQMEYGSTCNILFSHVVSDESLLETPIIWPI